MPAFLCYASSGSLQKCLKLRQLKQLTFLVVYGVDGRGSRLDFHSSSSSMNHKTTIPTNLHHTQGPLKMPLHHLRITGLSLT